MNIRKINVSSIKDLMGFVMSNGEGNEKELVAILLWRIWYARNKLIFERTVSKVEVDIAWAKSFMLEYIHVHDSHKSQVQQKLKTEWQPPGQDLLKLNVDAAWKQDKTAVGIIVRDGEGQIMAAVAESIEHTISVEHAELMAVYKALQWAVEVGIEAFILESDSSNVIRRLNSAERDLSPIGHLVDKAKEIKIGFQCCIFSRVCRSGNMPAHLLAKLALRIEQRMIWWNDFPSLIVKVAMQDLKQ